MSDVQVQLQPGGYYHIYNHAVGTDKLFEKEKDYLYFLSKLKTHVLPVSEIISYCLIPNHFHLVVRIKSFAEVEEFLKNKFGEEKFKKKKTADSYFLSQQISKQYSNLFNTFSKHINFWKGRTGTLFKRNFRRKEIQDMAYLLRLISYIHQNPIDAGLVSQAQQWKYSSYAALLSDKPTLIPRKEIIDLFGGLENLKYFHLKRTEIQID
jgi:putative transposase